MKIRAFFTTSYILCKRILKQPVMYILLLCIPVICAVILCLPKSATSSGISAGIFFENEDELCSALKNKLYSENNAVTFIFYDDSELMKNDVITGVLECAYVFDSRFSASVSNGKLNRAIKYYVSPSSSLSSTVNEIVFGSLIQICSYGIIEKYISSEEFEAFDHDEVKISLFETYNKYCNGSETFHLDIETVNGLSLNNYESKDLGVTFPLRGMLSILIFLASLTGASLWLSDSENGIFAPRSRVFKLISSLIYPMFPAIIFLLCSELALALTSCTYSMQTEVFLSVRYIIILTIYCNLLCLVLKKSSHIISLIPVLVLGCLIFCPVFINFESFMPALAWIGKLFPPRYFM